MFRRIYSGKPRGKNELISFPTLCFFLDEKSFNLVHSPIEHFDPNSFECQFDDGDAGLARFLKAIESETNSSATCEDMPAVLGANIVPHAESPLLDPDTPSIYDHAVFTMSDGEQVGVIGIDVVQKTMESSQPDKGTPSSTKSRPPRHRWQN